MIYLSRAKLDCGDSGVNALVKDGEREALVSFVELVSGISSVLGIAYLMLMIDVSGQDAPNHLEHLNANTCKQCGQI